MFLMDWQRKKTWSQFTQRPARDMQSVHCRQGPCVRHLDPILSILRAPCGSGKIHLPFCRDKLISCTPISWRRGQGPKRTSIVIHRSGWPVSSRPFKLTEIVTTQFKLHWEIQGAGFRGELTGLPFIRWEDPSFLTSEHLKPTPLSVSIQLASHMALSEKLLYFRQSCPRFREVSSGHRHWSTESNWQLQSSQQFFSALRCVSSYWLKYPHRCSILLMLLFICNIGEDYLVMVCEQSHTQIHAYRLALWLQTSKWRSLNSLWNGHGPCFHVEFRECITPSISLYHYIIISVYLYISSCQIQVM